MKQLSSRQILIYEYILKNGPSSNRQIKVYMDSKGESISRVTIVRELDELVHANLILKKGAGRSTYYHPIETSTLLHYFDPSTYFNKDIDHRNHLTQFNFDVFNNFTEIFSRIEQNHLQSLTEKYRKNLGELTKTHYQKEVERLTIELSWKSSQIEGNTYTLLDTEALIKEHRYAPGTTPNEAKMILNHKTAIDYILAHPNAYKSITTRDIEDIHRLLVEGLNVPTGLREGLVRITGTNFTPLDNIFQIQDALKKMVATINQYKDVFHKALAEIVLISYIQPFMDGNKRTARLIGNALLQSGNACPLSYRSIDPVDYKKAILLFYEQNSLLNFKDLFIAQYEFSVKNYFTLH